MIMQTRGIIQVHFWICLSLLALSLSISSGCQKGSSTPVQNKIAAQQYEQCLICHSTKEMQRGPILDGLDAWYLEAQFKKFKQGIRGTHPKNHAAILMAPIAKDWKQDNLKPLMQYISERPKPHHIKTVKGNLENGKKVFKSCMPCHGEQGLGNQKLFAPSLIVLEDWYLAMQLRAFKNKRRGFDSRDTQGQIMMQAAQSLSKDDIKDVTAYIQSIR